MSDFISKIVTKVQENRQIALLAGFAVVASAGLLYTFAGKGADSELLPAVSEEEARKMMKSVLDKIKVLVPKMIRAAEGIKQQLAAQGQEIDDSQLMKTFILPHVDTAFADIQKSVLSEYDVDDDELEEAVDYYVKHGDAELTEITKKIKAIYKEFGGDVGEEVAVAASKSAQSMSIDDIISLMEELADRMATDVDNYAGQFVGAFGAPQSQASMEKFQMGLMQVAEEAEGSLLSARGLTSTDFQSFLVAHQTNQSLIQIFTQMQVDNKEIMARHGIAM